MKENREAVKIIRDLLLKELVLPSTYGVDESTGEIVPSVYIVSPDVSLGITDKLQIAISSISSSILGSNSTYKEQDGLFCELKDIAISDTIQIDIMSRNTDARIRRFEVIAALQSAYAKQLQEEWGCRIFQIPRNMTNVSSAEGSATIYRYSATIVVHYCLRYVNGIDYYDAFNFNGVFDSVESSFKVDGAQLNL